MKFYNISCYQDTVSENNEEEYAVRNKNIWTIKDGKGNPEGWKVNKELREKKIDTLTKAFEYSVVKYKSLQCLGTRTLIKREILHEDGKKLEKLTLGQYKYKTFAEAGLCMRKIASSFLSPNYRKKDKIAIFAESREEWILSAIAALRVGLTVVTIYATLNDAGVIHCINETEVETVFVSCETFRRLINLLPKCPKLKRLIVFEDQIDGIVDGYAIPEGKKIVPFSDFSDSNKSLSELPDHPDQDDLAVIMYTSGSTGTPKGVEITHENIFYSMLSYFVVTEFKDGDRYLAFLPLSHIMELATEFSQFVIGCAIAYSSPLTLSTNSPKIANGTVGDAVVANPTKINAVPLILDRIVKGVHYKVSKTSPSKQRLFYKALSSKLHGKDSIMNKIWDSLIFKKIQAEFGGCLRSIVVGGAPVNPKTHNIIRAMFNCNVQIGYGCTESASSACGADVGDKRTVHTGGPLGHTKIRLENWEEGGYYTTDKPLPRGEILVGGKAVAVKYHKNEEETKKVFFHENGTNWFRTGDIGEIDRTGVLYIIDRKKNLVKLRNGEYISLGGVEATLKTHMFVDSICMFAYPTEDYPIAIVIPTAIVLDHLENAGIDAYKTLEAACEDQRVADLVCKSLQAHGKQNDLTKWDVPKKVYLTAEPWTPDNGLVTASMKIKRKNIEEAFKKQINDLYSI